MKIIKTKNKIMCWVTENKKFIEKKIADKNISVFKIVNYFKNSYSEIISSYFYSFIYRLDKVYTDKNSFFIPIIDKRNKKFRIYVGFHSYNESSCQTKLVNDFRCNKYLNVNFHNIEIDLYRYEPSLAIMHCIIPEGSEYYENEYGEIISNQLKPISIEEFKSHSE